MAEPILNTYLFVPNGLSDAECDRMIIAFNDLGHSRGCILRAASVCESVRHLPSEAILRIESVDCCDSFGELLELLVLLEERGCTLHLAREPWLNEAIRDCTYCIGKMRSVMERCQAQ